MTLPVWFLQALATNAVVVPLAIYFDRKRQRRLRDAVYGPEIHYMDG